ncbi:LamG-like jellyroll fold domain-containing protein [Streptomyces tailanensis]|uniref:LamG-like jellyroll fold domain-containing protein n=1 Tax=Streptomyces tailanensis TaxID=2569858 RepID=UPI001FED259C|nr:LamG-like jellyroll fold domain-containing protein [Streptomyces tailanensis]
MGGTAFAAGTDLLDGGSVEAARSLASAEKPEPMSKAEASANDGSSESTKAAQDALAAAAATGAQVEVPELRTEYATTYANPDGVSFTLEDSAVPVRVKGAGGWATPDATLEVRSDGSVGPKAAAVDLSFSGGGDGSDLLKIARDGRSLSLGWPGELPEPVLDGDSALYSEVLPGVDLKLTASVEGFREVLIVKSAQAAASEELAEVSFALDTAGLDVKETAAGGMEAVDGDGVSVFRSPQAQMWDSAGSAAQSSLSTQLTTAASDESEEPADGASTTDGSDGPSDGSALALLPIDVTDDELALTPDPQLLQDAVFPLYIDPTVTWSEAERTLLRSDGYADYAWTNGDDDEGKGMGYCGTYVTGGYAYYCGSGYKQRLYFEFSPSSLKGKHVLDATFRVTETWSMSCTASWVNLTRTNGISSSSDWPGPSSLDLMVDRYVAAGRGSACDPSQPSAEIEFNDNAEETNENLTSTVKNFAAGKFSRLPLMLRATDESDPNSWKRFKNNAVLSVKFVGLPATPTGIGIVTGDGTACEKDSGDPAIVSDPTPSLAATAQTKSGGENDASLKIYFDIDKKAGDGTWSDAAAGNGNLRPADGDGYVGDGKKVTIAWSTLSEDVLYRYRAWTRSYYNDGDSWLSGSSNASTTGWCYFQVDPTRPLKPTIAITSPYSECTANACASAGGPGIAASFTFTAADGDTNVAYQYKLSTDTAWSSEISGNKVTASVTPDTEGTYRLYARAKDSLGRWGAQNLIDFKVSDGEAPQAEWHFDEASGSAVDSGTGVDADEDTLVLSASGAARDGRGRRGTDVDTGVEDTSLLLDGSSGYAATDGAVLDTSGTYTVSAWVRLDDITKPQVLLSQSGSLHSPFYVLYNPVSGRWGMATTSSDTSSATASYSYMAAPTAANRWTHLAFVHNATTQTMRLIVNGEWYIEKAAAGGWSSSGNLQVGRGLLDGVFQYPLDGSVDEVKAWQRGLSFSEIAREARALNPTTGDQYAELTAHWDAATAESGATTLTDASGYGRALTVSGGAGTDGEAIVLDGTDDAASSDGVVDDTGSFTVTTVVSPDLEALAAKGTGYVAQVVGKRDKDGTSNWGVFFEVTGSSTVAVETSDGDIVEKTVATGFWHFGRYNDDGTFTSQVSEEATTDSGEVRITGVYNAQDGIAALYLNDNLQYTALSYATDFSAEALAVGNGYTSGAWGHHLPGAVSEVRLWAGAASDTDQITSMLGE